MIYRILLSLGFPSLKYVMDIDRSFILLKGLLTKLLQIRVYIINIDLIFDASLFKLRPVDKYFDKLNHVFLIHS